MKKMLIKSLLVLSIVILLGALSCGQKAGESVALEEYNVVKAQLTAAEARIAQLEDTPVVTVAAPGDPALKDEIASLKAKIEEIENINTKLDQQNESITREKDTLDAEYQDLVAENENLKDTITELTKPPAAITKEKVEQAIFTLINQKRVENSIPELSWGRNLYNITVQHSRHMEDIGRFEYSTWPFFHEIYWAAAYSSVEDIAEGALLVWQTNPNQYYYEHGILSKAFKYGAVGVYIEGDVAFITFMAADVP